MHTFPSTSGGEPISETSIAQSNSSIATLATVKTRLVLLIILDTLRIELGIDCAIVQAKNIFSSSLSFICINRCCLFSSRKEEEEEEEEAGKKTSIYRYMSRKTLYNYFKTEKEATVREERLESSA